MVDVRSRMPTVFGDLRHNRSFLNLFAGRLVTNAGDSLYYIAAMWLVFELTGSPVYTGIAGFLVRAPSALTFLTGPLVDRWALRRVLVSTQLINGLLVLTVPLAAWTGNLSVWVILAVLPLVTLVNQFVYPAQTAALPQLVADDNLAKANSLLSAAYQGADLVFNAASGVLIALVGAVTLFVVDSMTFGLALVLFLGVTVADTSPTESQEAVSADDTDDNTDTADGESADAEDPADEAQTDYLGELRDGFTYIRGSLLTVLLIGVVVVNFSAGAMFGVMPAFAATLGGASTYGLLMAAYAGGSLAGTLGASYVEDRPLGRILVGANVVAGLLMTVALVTPWFPATLGLFFLAFVPIGTFNVLFWTALQSAVDNDLLGRVSSLVTSAATVAVPVGSAVGGPVASAFGSRTVIFGWAIGNFVFGIYVVLRPQLRSLPAAAEIDAEMLAVGFSGGATATDENGPAVATGTTD